MTSPFKRCAELVRFMAETKTIEEREVEPLGPIEQQKNLMQVLVLLGLGSVLPLVDGRPPLPPDSPSATDD